MRTLGVWMGLCGLVLSVATACGKAEIGEECEKSGTTTDECVDGAICTAQDGKQYCYKICTDQAECTATEACNGVSGSNQKSCQPQS